MALLRLNTGDLNYPIKLEKVLGEEAPRVIVANGNNYLLGSRSLAFFAPPSCPADLRLHCYLLAQQLRRYPITVVSGFDSPVEQECLTILLGYSNPIIVCPAREIESMRIPFEYKPAMEMGRLLVISPFTGKATRSAEAVAYRNKMVSALADEVFTACADQSGKSEELYKQVLSWDTPLLTFSSRSNKRLVDQGAKPIFPDHAFR